MTFMEKLRQKWAEGKFVCVGLDPVWEKLLVNVPPNNKRIRGELDWTSASVTYEFLRWIIEETKDFVGAYKPNPAFFLCDGASGISVLESICKYIHENTDVPIVLDGKFGDPSDRTNAKFAKFAFENCLADAVTVNAYVGEEPLRPFLERTDKGVIVLVRTSNMGGGEFQDLETMEPDPEGGLADRARSAMALYRRIAVNVAETWNKSGNCCLVVGATYPKQASWLRTLVGDLPFLLPGFGTQEADIKKAVIASRDSRGEGMIASASSSIIFSKNPREKTRELHEQINKHRLTPRYS